MRALRAAQAPLVAALFGIGCARARPVTQPIVQPNVQKTHVAWVDSVLGSMTLRQKAAQMV